MMNKRIIHVTEETYFHDVEGNAYALEPDDMVEIADYPGMDDEYMEVSEPFELEGDMIDAGSYVSIIEPEYDYEDDSLVDEDQSEDEFVDMMDDESYTDVIDDETKETPHSIGIDVDPTGGLSEDPAQAISMSAEEFEMKRNDPFIVMGTMDESKLKTIRSKLTESHSIELTSIIADMPADPLYVQDDISQGISRGLKAWSMKPGVTPAMVDQVKKNLVVLIKTLSV